MPRDYKNGKVYKLISDETNFIYVGSTTQQLSKRLYEHKDNAKRGKSKVYETMRDVGIDTFRIVLINEFPCENKEQLCKEEERCRKEIAQDKLLNTSKCYANVPFGLPVEEYTKEYKKENKDKILECNKEYRKKNKDKIQEYKREYNKENKDKIQEYRKENKDKIQENKKEYYTDEDIMFLINSHRFTFKQYSKHCWQPPFPPKLKLFSNY